MKTIKIGFTDTVEPIANFFVNTLAKRFIVVRDDLEPDYLIFGDRNFGDNNLRYDPNKVTKIFYTGENQRPWHYNCHYSISFDYMENDNRNYRLPLYVIYDFDNNLKQTKTAATRVRRLEDIQPDKAFCSFVVRNGGCEMRNAYFYALSKYKSVHAGGSLFRNVDPVGDTVQDKFKFLDKYKFNLCFENSSHPGYTTEKLYEALLANTIPIYWGDPLVAQDFNTKAFLNWHDYGNDNAFFNKIIELDNDPEQYAEMYMQPMFNNNYNKYMDLDLFLNWFETKVIK